jgi:arylsulfatase A-like enzyme
MSGSKIARVMPSPATPGGISLDETTIASMLRAEGYLTGMVGKWHVGMGRNCSQCPLAHGFDSYWGMPVTNVQACGQRNEWVTQRSMFHFILDQHPAGLVFKIVVGLLVASALACAGGLLPRSLVLVQLLVSLLVIYMIYWVPSTIMLLNPKACVLYEGNAPIEQPVQLKYLTHRETVHATRFLEQAAALARPFFLYMSYTKVHTALFVADEREGVSQHGAYGDNVEEMDWSVGELLGALERLGLDDNTWVYFSSDNGPWRESRDEGGACGRAPADLHHDLKGGKAQTWECGLRVPAIVRWPAGYGKPGRTEGAATSNLDVLPTVAAITGVTIPTHVSETGYAPAPAGIVDGRDLSRLLSGQLAPGEAVHEFLFHYCDMTVAAVRHGRYKAHFATTAWEDPALQICPTGLICKCATVPQEPPLVYDIEADPAELRPIDLAGDAVASATVERMRAARAKQEASVIAVPSQTELRPEVGNFPCCGYPHPGWARTLAVLLDRCGC